MKKAKTKIKPEFTAESTMQFLTGMRVPHTVKQCSSSTSIKIHGGRSYFYPNSEEKIPAEYLKFITDTKKEVCANAKEKNFDEVNPKFIRFSPVFDNSFYYGCKKFSEVDITGAYWFQAYDYGLITKTTYEQGLTVPKKVRLMALGAAASTKDVFEFNGTDYEHQGIEFDPEGRLAFFNIAKRIDEIMNIIMADLPGVAAFYWVDAVFVKSEFADYVAGYIADFGFQSKTVPLAWIRGSAETRTVQTMKILSENENLCEFQRKIYFKPRKKINKLLKKNQ